MQAQKWWSAHLIDGHGLVVIVGLLFVVVAHGAAIAQSSAVDTTSKSTVVPVAALFSVVQANAFVSFGYPYNFNKPASRLNGYRIFDVEDNQFTVDVAELVLQRPIAKVGDAGFRVDFEAGTGAPAKAQAYGLALGQNADLQQALISYLAPVGQGLRLDFGKFVTPLGYEVIEGYDGYNDNYSRSLLFNYAIPLTHTGVKAGYTFGTLSTMLMVVNGWDNVKDNNVGKSVGGQLVWTPAEPVAFYVSYIGGPEKTDTSGYVRHTVDVVASWKAAKSLTLTLNGDYGTESKASLFVPGANAVWKGLAAYAKLDATSVFSIALRAETLHDNGGTRLGASAPASISEVTLTPSLKVGDHMVMRGDVRYDHASEDLFIKKLNVPTRSQSTVALNVIFVY